MSTAVVTKPRGAIIDNHTAHKIVQLGLKFFSDPKNVQGYRAWHLKEYGCLPEEVKGAEQHERKR